MVKAWRSGAILGLVLMVTTTLALAQEDAPGMDAPNAPTTDVTPDAPPDMNGGDMAPAAPDAAPAPTVAPVAAATPTAIPAPRPGDVLFSESFDDPTVGHMPTGPVPQGSLAYVGGEYQILRTDKTTNLGAGGAVPGKYINASMAFDVRMPNVQTGDYFNIRCRNGAAGLDTGYRATIRLSTQQIELDRLDGDVNNPYILVGRRTADGLRAAAVNHIELTCIGQTISVAVNGTIVTAAQDGKYADGGMLLVTGGAPGHLVEARVDNLVVTQR